MAEEPSPPPSVPRPLTAHVRRRAWVEPRVRFWWMAAIAMLITGGGFIVIALHSRSHEIWLIDHGIRINSTVVIANGETVKKRPQLPDSMVILHFQWNGQEYEPRARTLPGRTEFIVTGSVLPIHVNPNNPEDWTWLDQPLPLLHTLIGAIISFLMAVIAVLMAWLLQRQAVRVWQKCDAVAAWVVDTQFTAIAPRSRAARVTPDMSSDNRLYTVYLPPSLEMLQRGDMLYILRPSAGSSTSVAAAWFE